MKTEFYTSPPSYDSYVSKIFALKKEYPFLKLFHIGKSILGRKIYALGLGNIRGANLFAGAFHAQEWLTCSLLVMFIEQVCKSISKCETIAQTSYNEILTEKGFVIIPMVNPDGVEIAINGAQSAKHLKRFVENTMTLSDESWQANARGVDLNHNFDAGFLEAKKLVAQHGITSPMPRRYGGQSPHSEPEVKALVNICFSLNIRSVFAFHSQGEEIYYEYAPYTPKISKYMAKLLASYCSYSVSVPEKLASHAGFKDWFIKTFNRPGFTVEIGKGINPLPISDLNEIYLRLETTLVIASVI